MQQVYWQQNILWVNKMHLEPDQNNKNLITEITNEAIIIKNRTFKLPVLITDQVAEYDNALPLEEMQIECYKKLIEGDPELVIVGTGKFHKWPKKDIMNQLTSLECNFEFMHNVAAVSTYNLLISDHRHVTLLLTHV